MIRWQERVKFCKSRVARTDVIFIQVSVTPCRIIYAHGLVSYITRSNGYTRQLKKKERQSLTFNLLSYQIEINLITSFFSVRYISIVLSRSKTLKEQATKFELAEVNWIGRTSPIILSCYNKEEYGCFPFGDTSRRKHRFRLCYIERCLSTCADTSCMSHRYAYVYTRKKR